MIGFTWQRKLAYEIKNIYEQVLSRGDKVKQNKVRSQFLITKAKSLIKNIIRKSVACTGNLLYLVDSLYSFQD